MTKWICDECATPCKVDDGRTMTKRVPRLACAHNPDWREVKDEEPADGGSEFPFAESLAMGYTWTGTPPDSSTMYLHANCPDCKEKDAEIERVTRLRDEVERDWIVARGECKVSDNEVMEKAAEIERLKKLVAEKEKAIGECHEMIESERAKNAVMVDNDIDQLKEIISKIDDIRYALDSLELR